MAVTDVIAQVKAVFSTNGVGAITGAGAAAAILAVVNLYATPITGDVSGNLPALTISPGAVTAADLATGAASANVGILTGDVSGPLPALWPATTS